MIRAVAATARRLTPAEWLALAGGLATFGYVGWDGALWDPRYQLALHLLALGAALLLVVLALRGGPLPRTRLELPILLLLFAFGIATLSAQNAGLSARALVGIVATAAMLPIAVMALRRHPSLVGIVVATPIILLSIGALAVMAGRRIAWYVVGGPGLLPPIRMPAEGTPFGSVAVPPFVILAALPLTMLVEPPRLRRWLQVGLVAVGAPLTALSGSRSAWLAIGIAAIIFVVPHIRHLRLSWPQRVGRRELLLAIPAVAVAAVGVAVVAPRLTAISSLLYRGNLWRDTLAAWSTDPLLGIGPGAMPFARQAAAAPFSFPVRQPHSHNLALGLLGDAGVVGLVAGGVLLIAFLWLAGPWRSRNPTGRAASSVLIGLAVAGLFEDLTFLPNFNLMVLLLAALALLDAGAVELRASRPLSQRGRIAAVAGVVAGLALGTIMAVGDAAAIAYRAGTDAAGNGQWEVATSELQRSVALDPWHPSGPKALVVTAGAVGDDGLAREAAERAVELNPGDGPSWTNLALLCMGSGDVACAAEAAVRSMETARVGSRELVNAARVLDALGLTAPADRAYLLSLQTNRSTALAVRWPRPVDLDAPPPAETDPTTVRLNLLVARVALGAPLPSPDSYPEPHLRAVAAALAGDDATAHAALATAIETLPDNPVTWELATLLRYAWGEDEAQAAAVAALLHGEALPGPDDPPDQPWLIFDIATFRAYPGDEFIPSAERMRTAHAWPWVLLPYLDVTGPRAAGAG